MRVGRILRAALLAAALTGCSVSDWPVSREEIPAGLDDYAIDFLGSIQADSIADRAEYCGYFYTTPGGIAATEPNRGTKASCRFGAPPPTTVATWHTHGAYDEGYDNEVPSSQDLRSDFLIRRQGYVSTPGGRVWKTDWVEGETFQLCGRGCVPSDPGWVAEDEGRIRRAYTLSDLEVRRSER